MKLWISFPDFYGLWILFHQGRKASPGGGKAKVGENLYGWIREDIDGL